MRLSVACAPADFVEPFASTVSALSFFLPSHNHITVGIFALQGRCPVAYEVSGQRLKLRDYVSENLDTFHRWISDPEVMRFLDFGSESKQESLVHLSERIEEQSKEEREVLPCHCAQKTRRDNRRNRDQS